MVEEFLYLRVRDARGVRAFRTTTGRSWADPAPKHKGGYHREGKGAGPIKEATSSELKKARSVAGRNYESLRGTTGTLFDSRREK